MNPVLAHMDYTEIRAQTMTDLQSFTFAAACVERQWSVYERAAVGRLWDCRKVLRATLDIVWDWLEQTRTRPGSYSARCEAAVIDYADPLAFNVAGHIWTIIEIVEKNQPEKSYLLGRFGLDLIDAFLYEHLNLHYSEESDWVVFTHELMQNEIRRQIEDLDLLDQPFNVSLVESLRTKYTGVSVLGDFPK